MRNRLFYLFLVGLCAAPGTVFSQAVDNANGKLNLIVGTDGMRGIDGAFTFPTGENFGAQIDVGTYEGDLFKSDAFAGHFFWREPDNGLIGLYVGHVKGKNLHNLGGNQLRMNEIGVQLEKFFDSFTLRAMFGSLKHEIDYRDTSGNAIFYKNRDYKWKAKFSYYPQNNLALFASAEDIQGSVGNETLGVEWQFGQTKNTAYAVSAEIVETKHFGSATSIGFRVYFDKPKDLKARHRRADPTIFATLTASGNYSCPPGYNLFRVSFVAFACIVPGSGSGGSEFFQG